MTNSLQHLSSYIAATGAAYRTPASDALTFSRHYSRAYQCDCLAYTRQLARATHPVGAEVLVRLDGSAKSCDLYSDSPEAKRAAYLAAELAAFVA